MTPKAKVTPWEVKSGSGVTNLDASIQKGQAVINVSSDKVIEVLGIRTKEAKVFTGLNGISPQIDYQNAVNYRQFNSVGEAPLTLVVTNEAGEKIGKLDTYLLAQGVVSELSISTKKGARSYLIAPSTGFAFFGGLGDSPDWVSRESQGAYMPEIEDHWITQDVEYVAPSATKFDDNKKTYSGYYLSLIKPNRDIKITLR